MRFQISTLGLVIAPAVAALVYVGYMAYQREQAQRLARRCPSNRNLIDKCVGVWESQNIALGQSKRPLWLELDTEGRIVRTSDSLAEEMLGRTSGVAVPTPATLKPGSDVFFLYTRDTQLFRCPGRIPSGDLSPLGQVHYKWMLDRAPIPALEGRTRGAVCLVHPQD